MSWAFPCDASWNVMRCHDPHAGGSYPVVGSGMRLEERPLLRLRGRACPEPRSGGLGQALFRPAAERERGERRPFRASGRRGLRKAAPPGPCCRNLSWIVPFLPLRSVFPPPACPVQRDPDSRVMRAGARARRRAFRGGAVRAPDCACAREAWTQGARLPSASRGFFRAGANRERERPRGSRSFPHMEAMFRYSSFLSRLFSEFVNILP